MKKRTRTFVALGVIMSAFLSGCSNRSELEDSVESSQTVETESPFDLEEIEQSGQTVDAAYGWGITNYDDVKREIDYEEGKLQLDISFDNLGDECEVGLIVFIDGVLQNYSLNNSEDAESMIPITLKKEETSEVSIYVDPSFGNVGSEHRMDIACVYEPSYHASAENISYGNYLNMSPNLPWKINYENQDSKVETSSSVTYTKIPDEVKQEYIVKRDDGTTTNKLDTIMVTKYLQESQQIEHNTIDASKDFQLQVFGGAQGKYRLCLFVNNEAVLAFDGMESIDIEVKEDQIATIDVALDTSEIDIEDYSSMYVVLCPISDSGYSDEEMIDKTKTMILMP